MDRPVVLVTGANRGLGRAIVYAFAKNKFDVVIHTHSHPNEAQQTLNEIEQFGVRGLIVKADVRSSQEVNTLVSTIKEKWKRIDVVVNNAGNTRNQLIARMSDEEWNDVLNTNLNGPFYVTRAVLPLMKEQKHGVIINLASYLSLRPAKGSANYAASKAGLVALTKATAVEGGIFNIRANAVMPGFHVTDMNADIWKKNEQQIRSQHLLPYMADKTELAEFIVHVSLMKTVSGQVFSFESRLV